MAGNQERSWLSPLVYYFIMSTPTDSSSPIAASPCPPQVLQRRKGSSPNGSFEMSSMFSEQELNSRSMNKDSNSQSNSQEEFNDWRENAYNYQTENSTFLSTTSFNRSHISNTRSTLPQDRYTTTTYNTMENTSIYDFKRHEKRQRNTSQEHANTSHEYNNHPTTEFNVVRKFNSLDIRNKQEDSTKRLLPESSYSSSIFGKSDTPELTSEKRDSMLWPASASLKTQEDLTGSMNKKSSEFMQLDSDSTTIPKEKYQITKVEVTRQYDRANQNHNNTGDHCSPNSITKSRKNSITSIEHQNREPHSSLESGDISEAASIHNSRSDKASSPTISPNNSLPTTLSSCNLTQEISTGSASFNSFGGWCEHGEASSTQNQSDNNDQQSEHSFPYCIEQEANASKDSRPSTLEDDAQPSVQNTSERNVSYLQQAIQSNSEDDTQPYVQNNSARDVSYLQQAIQSNSEDDTQPYVQNNSARDVSYIQQAIQSSSEDDTQPYVQNTNERDVSYLQQAIQSSSEDDTQPYVQNTNERDVSYLQQTIQSNSEGDTQPYVQNTNERDVSYLQQVIQSNQEGDTQPNSPKQNEEESLYPQQTTQSTSDDSTQPYIPYNNEHDISYVQQAMQYTAEDDTQSYIHYGNGNTQSAPDNNKQLREVHHKEEEEVPLLQKVMQFISDDYDLNTLKSKRSATSNLASNKTSPKPNKRTRYTQTSQDLNTFKQSASMTTTEKAPYTIHPRESFFLNPAPVNQIESAFFIKKVLDMVPKHMSCIRSRDYSRSCWENEEYNTLDDSTSSTCKYVDQCELSSAILGLPRQQRSANTQDDQGNICNTSKEGL
ncbi:hypothetical protein F4703DRAFT_1053502 [Phycomyces blakesleeanus]